MAWSFPKVLKRTGAPALGVFIAMTAFAIVKRDPGASVAGIVQTNALLIAAVWMAVAALMFLGMRLFAQRSAQR